MPDWNKAEKIQALFSLDKLSSALAAEILVAFDALGSERVAVRSSSSLEDMHGASFAGQYSSYLGVKRAFLLKAVIECWKSLWNERAIAYRTNHLQGSRPEHAVIVQSMVSAVCSGVLFTANPMNGSRHEYVINASYGLGEAIVSGEVMPDQYVYDTKLDQVIEKNINKKEILYVYAQEGVEKIEVDVPLMEKPALKTDTIQALAHVGREIQAFYKSPQDIEFAVDSNGEVFILQARPITTLFPIDGLEQDEKLHAYLAASSVLLGMKEPFTPLGADVYGGMFPKVIEVMTRSKKKVPTEIVKYTGARIFIDITYLLSSKFVSKNFASAFSGSDMPLKSTFDLLKEKHGQTFTNQGVRFKIPWGVVGYGLSMIPVMRKASKFKGKEKYDEIIRLGKEVLSEIELTAQKLHTTEEKLDFCDQMMLQVFMLTQKQAMYCTQVGSFGKLQKKVSHLFGSKYNLDILSYALPGCITVEMSMQMNKLAKYYDTENKRPDPSDAEFKVFLDMYGHRATIELDFGTPRWKEDSSYLVKQIEFYMKDKAYERNLKAHAQNALKAEQMIRDIYNDTVQLKGKRYASRLKNDLEAYRIAAGMREYPKFNILQGLDIARRVMLSLGEALSREDLIKNPNDIFYVHKNWLLDRLSSYENASAKDKERVRSAFWAEVDKNKKHYQRELERKNIPRIILNSGESYYSGKVDINRDGVIKGYPLSSGTYTGKIRIVHNPQKAQLEEGEIMVAESTNPAWTPLFMTAGALIMEYGGPLSHGGIVAREYGIPAVVGISAGAQGLKNGQKVKVDGYNGTIEILKNDRV